MVTNIEVVYKDYSSEGDCDFTDKWDQPDVYHSINITGIRKASRYYDLELEGDYDPNKDYFLLSVTYETGDSFHREYGKVAFVGIYSDQTVAEENARRIRQHYDFYGVRDNYRTERALQQAWKGPGKFKVLGVVLTMENGKEYLYHPSWVGYFENLVEIEVKRVRDVEYMSKTF